MSKPVSTQIIEASRVIWDELFEHPFVVSIADGTLGMDQFRHFMIQDYLYLLEYARVFSIGAGKASDPVVMNSFYEYVSNIFNGELEIHRSYMKKLGIDKTEAETAYVSQDNLSYTSYMLRIAYEYGPAEICAAILPCAISYEVISKRMISKNPACAEHPFFGEWIKGYASDEYHNENEKLKKLTDRAASGYGEFQTKRLSEIGIRSSIYEKSFWDMAWEMRK